MRPAVCRLSQSHNAKHLLRQPNRQIWAFGIAQGSGRVAPARLLLWYTHDATARSLSSRNPDTFSPLFTAKAEAPPVRHPVFCKNRMSRSSKLVSWLHVTVIIPVMSFSLLRTDSYQTAPWSGTPSLGSLTRLTLDFHGKRAGEKRRNQHNRKGSQISRSGIQRKSPGSVNRN